MQPLSSRYRSAVLLLWTAFVLVLNPVWHAIDHCLSDSHFHIHENVIVSQWAEEELGPYCDAVSRQGFSPAFGPNWSYESRSSGLKPEIGHNDVPQSINAGEQRSQGVELEFQANLGSMVKGLTIFSNYAYTDFEWVDFRFVPAFETEEVDASGLTVSLVPEHTVQAGLNQRIGYLKAGVWLTYSSDYYVDRMNTVKTGAYTVLNASLSYPSPVEGLHLTVTGLNLLDTDYYHYFGNVEGARIALPGRPFELIAALRYQL